MRWICVVLLAVEYPVRVKQGCRGLWLFGQPQLFGQSTQECTYERECRGEQKCREEDAPVRAEETLALQVLVAALCEEGRALGGGHVGGGSPAHGKWCISLSRHPLLQKRSGSNGCSDRKLRSAHVNQIGFAAAAVCTIDGSSGADSKARLVESIR